MLVEIVNNYKLSKEKDRYEISQIIENNQRINFFTNALSEELKFSKLNINALIDFLKENNSLNYQEDELKTTLIYIQRNNSFKDKICLDFLKNLKDSLNSLIKEMPDTSELDTLILRTNKLLNSITNQEVFIEDMQFLVEIVKELDISQDKIFEIMLEINNHNLKVVKKNDKNDLKEQKLETKKDFQDTNLNLLKKYGYELNLSLQDQNDLEKINQNELEEKLKYFTDILEFSFLKNKDYKEYLLILLYYVSVENIKNIYEISVKYGIDLIDILPSTYLNTDFKTNKQKYDYLKGTYDYFIENIKMLESLGYDISLTYKDSLVFFLTETSKIKENYQTLKTYKIYLNKNNPSLISVLTMNNLVSRLDKFIELGLLDYVRENQTILLNKDEAIFHRIYFARKNNLPIKRRYLLSEITSINGYNVTEENYLKMTNTYTSPYFNSAIYREIREEKSEINLDIEYRNLIKELDKAYLIEDNIYYISGVYVSRFKVLRLYQSILNKSNKIHLNHFEGILFAVLEGLIIDLEKFKEIVLDILKLYFINSYIYIDVLFDICKKLNIKDEEIALVFKNKERTI